MLLCSAAAPVLVVRTGHRQPYILRPLWEGGHVQMPGVLSPHDTPHSKDHRSAFIYVLFLNTRSGYVG
jgi:hypothetical protein